MILKKNGCMEVCLLSITVPIHGLMEKDLKDIKKSVLTRGTDPRFFYNCFYRINGAEDKLTYANELFQLQLELKNAGRKTVVVNGEIERPTPDEIAEIRRGNYAKTDQLIMDLSTNIKYPQI